MSATTIRKALPSDVPAIHGLIQAASKVVPVIPKSHFEIYADMRDFFVFDEGNGVQGCCALHITWHDLAEVKSLVVDESLRGRGIGRLLVEAAIEEARALGLSRVFALTNVADFFGRLGFVPVDRHELPQKIWGECIRCPRFPDCDEVSVVYHTGIAPTASVELPNLT